MTPTISIVIPCHARSALDTTLLADTLDSVAVQTRRDYEIVLVDDGSTWRIDDVAAGRERLTLIRQPQAGPAHARNAGIAASRGEYLIFLDADDLLLPDAAAAGLAAFADQPAAGFVVGPREEMTFEGDPVPWTVAPPPPQTRLYLPLLAFDWYIIPPSSAMFRREVVEAVGAFRDPWGADDLDFYLRAAHAFEARCYQSPPVTRYRRYSTSSSRDGERMLRSVRTVYERQWPLVAGNPAGEEAFARGLHALTEIFQDCLVENVRDRLRAGHTDAARRAARILGDESPSRLTQLLADAEIAAALSLDAPSAAQLEVPSRLCQSFPSTDGASIR
jgi:glycosyltransferase involved in cell wall biosynthesis